MSRYDNQSSDGVFFVFCVTLVIAVAALSYKAKQCDEAAAQQRPAAKEVQP